MSTLRLSVVQYLNTAPLIWGMLHGEQRGRFEMDFTTPARCADAVRDGTVDAGIIPSIEVQRIGGLAAVSGISISALDEVRSVILIAKRPVEEVRSVRLDTSSRTSAALASILLHKFYGVRPEMAPAAPDAHEMLKSADAALLIGDPALVFSPRAAGIGGELLVYDLAAEWKRFTGLPFVFAVWAGPDRGRLSRAAKDFQASRDFGLERVDEIAAEYAPRHALTPDDVKIYLTRNINYNLGESHLEALRLFYSFAAEEGLIPGVKEIQFV